MTNFTAKRVTRSYKQTINAKPGIVFPLLCPVREADWADGWKSKVIYAETGYAEENGVYATQHSGKEDTIWMITDRDTVNHKIEFVYFVPGVRVTRLNISVKGEPDNTSSVYIKYIITAITENGNRIIEHHNTEEEFIKQMQHWEASMNYYLETGQMLKSE